VAALKNAAAAALALAAVLYAEPARAGEVPPWRAHVAEAAARFAIPEAWILRVIDAESGGRTHLHGRPITSPAGAMGLMQIMPGTWTELRRQHRLGPDPHDPRDNILAGTAYLRRMYERFGYPGLFAAYNAGPGRYRAYLERRRPLPRETRAYVARIAGSGWIAASRGHRDGNVLRRADGGRGGTRAAPRDPIFLVSAGASPSDIPAPNAPAMPPPDPAAVLHMPVGETAAAEVPAASPHDGGQGTLPHARSTRDAVFLWRRSAARQGE
jgi:hypothetical protein